MKPRSTFRIPIVALGVVMVALSGCGEPEPQIYVLGHGASIGQSESSQLNNPVVDVRPIRIPDYLDNKNMVVRRADGRIVASQDARWGERLSLGVTRAVTTSLATRLPRLAVMSSPPGTPQWRVLIDIDAFEVQSTGRCVLAGRWSVWVGGGERKLRDERFAMSAPVDNGTDAEIVAAMTQLVDRLATDVAVTFFDDAAPRRVASH
jgi:uncharacterized protein